MNLSERSNLIGTAIFGYLSLIEVEFLLSTVMGDIMINQGISSSTVFWTGKALFVLFVSIGILMLKSFSISKGSLKKSFIKLIGLFVIIQVLQFGYTYFKFSIFPIEIVGKMGNYLDYLKGNPFLQVYKSGIHFLMFGVMAGVLLLGPSKPSGFPISE